MRKQMKRKAHSYKYPALNKLAKILRNNKCEKYYLGFSVLILSITTLFWSIKSAILNLSNSDQLIDPYLFQNSKTFRNAQFPGAHTFLLKWPLFYLIKLLGFSAGSYEAITVLVVLVTVGALAYILFRIDKRPLVLGTFLLALASVLLIIPAQSYPGALLPVNMAMLTTRNIEYVLYIASLVLFIKSAKIKSPQFCIAVIALALLISSDKIFIAFSLGGSLLAILAYSLIKRWQLVTLSARWLLGSIASTVLAVGLLGLIQDLKITNIVNQAAASPYSSVKSLHDLVLGIIYSITGLFTNLGANPASDTTVLRQIPSYTISHIFGVGGVSLIVNIVILAIGALCIYKVSRSSITSPKLSASYQLSVMLVFSTIAAFLVFILSDHAYSVDARYLTIALFTIFISAAVIIRSKRFLAERLMLLGLVLTVSIVFGLFAASQSFSKENAALAGINSRNTQIAAALHHVDGKILVGDYWRVLPIKFKADDNLQIMPLGNCTQARVGLTSSSWQYNLNKQGFVYLLSLSGSLTNYPNCSLKQVVNYYGKPNSSVLIAGSLSRPKELLLFYDRGIHKRSPTKSVTSAIPATIEPTSLSNLTGTSCSVPSIMNIVAHEDDDLLFMNPDLFNEIEAGDCVRTIYVTAGNAGAGEFYWLSREQGSEAAYSYMLGTNNIWIQKIVELAPNEFITIANPKGNTKVSLIFMYLPDGNLKGQGFSSSNFESLAKLQTDKINVINTVDHQSYYTSATLISALSTLMNVYQTSSISTQAGVVGQRFPDHSDHIAVGWYVKKAYAQFETQRYANQITIPIKFYIGYPVRQQPSNISGVALEQKEAIFLAYAKHDGNVCQTLQTCLQTPTYAGYLSREYQSTY